MKEVRVLTSLLFSAAIAVPILGNSAHAAIALDRTRVVFDGENNSVSLNVSNENKQLPYLVQGWLENTDGVKVNSPLTVVPPVQRLEAGAKSQIKVQSLPAIKSLPQDRESLFYFNLREIPPRSDKPNTLQIALQTRIKLFYRPAAITPTKADLANPWQEKMTLQRQGDRYQITNPTPYYVTVVDGGASATKSVPDFKPIMLAPFESGSLSASASQLGASPVLTYINDYGGHPQLKFTCTGNNCTAKAFKK